MYIRIGRIVERTGTHTWSSEIYEMVGRKVEWERYRCGSTQATRYESRKPLNGRSMSLSLSLSLSLSVFPPVCESTVYQHCRCERINWTRFRWRRVIVVARGRVASRRIASHRTCATASETLGAKCIVRLLTGAAPVLRLSDATHYPLSPRVPFRRPSLFRSTDRAHNDE